MIKFLKDNGSTVGKNVYFGGIIRFNINGEFKNLEIGDNVTIDRLVMIKNRENGRIVLGKNVTIMEGVKIVAARDANIVIGDGSKLAYYVNIDCGDDLTIGKNCAFSHSAQIICSQNKICKSKYIMEQEHEHKPIIIGEDCWLGSNSYIHLGTRLGRGVVVGANTNISGTVGDYSIVIGNPGRVIGARKDNT